MPSSNQILHNQTFVLIDALVTFVNRGLMDARAGTSFSIDYVAGSLARNGMQKIAFSFGFEDSVPKSKHGQETVAATNDAFERFSRYVKNSFIGGEAIAPPMLGNIAPEDYSEIIAQIGFTNHEYDSAVEDDPIRSAWRIARNNANRYLQRQSALGYLNSLCRESASLSSKESISAEVDKANSILLAKINEFWANELQLAILCGGEELEMTKDRMMKVAFSDNSGLARYVERDGYIGSNRIAAEELRAAIKHCAALNVA